MPSVLIVDDNLLIRTLMREILLSLGYSVLGEADNGIAAEASARRLRPDIVTLDLVMPERDGLETIPHLMAMEPAPTIIVCSASLDQRRVVTSLRRGAAGFIGKPFSRDAVRKSLEQALGLATKQATIPPWESGERFIDPSAMAEDDRREFERLTISLPVRLASAAGQPFAAETVDISAGGMLVTGGDLAIDTRVTFEISLGSGQEPVKGQARVVRINNQGQPGFIFERLLIADHERLTAYITQRSRLGLIS